MNKISVTWTRTARQDIKEIKSYLMLHTPLHADRIVKKIIYRIKQLEDFPLSAQREEYLKELKQDHRYLVVWNYKIIFRKCNWNWGFRIFKGIF